MAMQTMEHMRSADNEQYTNHVKNSAVGHQSRAREAEGHGAHVLETRATGGTVTESHVSIKLSRVHNLGAKKGDDEIEASGSDDDSRHSQGQSRSKGGKGGKQRAVSG